MKNVPKVFADYTMFHSKDRVVEKGNKSGRGRFEYLQTLVTEFQDCDKEDAKVQILANLANFAYDPLNYDYLRQLNVIDLFIDMLDDENEQKVEFAIGGLCNLTDDFVNKEYVLKNDGVSAVIGCLSSCNVETVLNAINTLINLITPESKKDIVCEEIIDSMKQLMQSSNPRLKNLATVFVEDFC